MTEVNNGNEVVNETTGPAPVQSPDIMPSDDPRVLAWQAANNLLGEAAQFEASSAEHSSRVSLAQVYATLAGVSSDVLTGIQLAQLTNHLVQAQQAHQQQVQDQVQQEVAEQLGAVGSDADFNDGTAGANGPSGNVIPLR